MPLLIALAVIAMVFISLGALSVKVTLLSLALKLMTYLLAAVGLLYVFQQFIAPIFFGRKP